MTVDVKIGETWVISQKEAEQATIEKCAHLHVSYRTNKADVEDGSVSGWWECNSGCGTRFIPVAIMNTSLVEHFQSIVPKEGDKP